MRMWKIPATLLAFAVPLLCSAEEPLCDDNKYKPDGHQHTTEFVAKSLQFDPRLQRRLAYFSQAPDDLALRFSAPAVGVWGVAWIPYRQRIVDTLHSLHGGNDEAVKTRRERLEKMISMYDLKQEENHWKVGFLIHAFGDSYAHVYEENGKLHSYSPVWGHIFDNTNPDVIANHPRRYAHYVTALCRALGTASGNASICTEKFGLARACAVVRPVPKFEGWHDASKSSSSEAEEKAELYQSINLPDVNLFLARVQRVLNAPPAPDFVIKAEDL